MGSLFVLGDKIEFPPPARDPLRIALAAATAAQGLGLVVGGPAPGTLEAVLPPLLVWVWSVGLAGAGVTLILAAMWRDAITSVLIELAGCVLAVLAIGAYTVAAFAAIGFAAFVAPVLITAGYGVGCGFRIVGIMRTLQRYRIRMQHVRVALRRPPWDGR